MKNKIIILAVFVMIVFNIPVSALNVKVTTIPKWSASVQYNEADTPEGYVDAKLIRDDEMTYDGHASLYTVCGGYKDNTWVKVSQNIEGLEPGGEYILTADMYSSTCSSNHQIRFGDTDVINCNQLKSAGKMENNTWSRIEYSFTYSYTSSVFTIINWNTGAWYIDNISLKKVLYDENDSFLGYGEELIKNGDFESDLDYTPCGEISDVSVNNKDESALISWKNPAEEDFYGCKVYKIDGNEEIYIQSVTGNSVEVSGLVNNIETIIIIKTEDLWGNLSEGIPVAVLPIADSFKKLSPVLRINGQETSSISQGTLEAEVSYKNNRMPEDYSVELVIALFKDGELVDINSSYSIIPQSSEDSEYTPVKVSITVPDDGSYSVVLYEWDSMTSMRALGDSYIYYTN